MPGEVLRTTEITFQWQYQDMKLQLTLERRGETNNNGILTLRGDITHERSNPIAGASRLDPGTDRSGVLPLLTVEYEIESPYLSAPSPRHVAGAVRGNVWDSLGLKISDVWVHQRGVASLRPDLASNWAYRLMYEPSRVRQIKDRVVQEVVTFVNTFVEDWTCPDNQEDCVAFHIFSHRHIRTSVQNRWVPINQIQYLEYDDEDGHFNEMSYWIWDPEFVPSGRTPAQYDQVANHLNLRECATCSNLRPQSIMISIPSFRGYYCPDCAEETEECHNCNQVFFTTSLTETELYDDEQDDYMVVFACRTCALQMGGNARLNLQPYSLKPTPIFNRLPDGTETLFMGMELEVARSSTTRTMQVNKWIRNLPDLFYVKSDSSVQNGMEVVTHPFTYEWAKQEFPYELFGELIQIEGVLPDHESAGTHIHLSKSAFDVTHMWKFILFFLENKQFFGTLGDRGHAHRYGSFEGSGMTAIRDNLLQIVKANGNSASLGLSTGRGAINLTPDNTIEMRFLAGNVKPDIIKKNQQLMKSAFDFTKVVKASDALKGALGDPGYFLGFLEDTDYEELKTHISKSFPTPKKLERTN